MDIVYLSYVDFNESNYIMNWFWIVLTKCYLM